MTESVILIRTGERVLVDPEDLPRLAEYEWTRHGDSGAPIRREMDIDGNRRQIRMGRDILDAPVGVQVRYKNRDPLDNRRANLVMLCGSQRRAARLQERVVSYGAGEIPGSTNHKGSAAEAAIIAVLYACGFSALRPFDGHAPYDLVIADCGHNLRRVQVKYRAKTYGELRIHLYSVQARRGGPKMVPVNFDFVDGYAIFNPTSQRVYFIPTCDIDRSRPSFILRPEEASSDPADLFRTRARAAQAKPQSEKTVTDE